MFFSFIVVISNRSYTFISVVPPLLSLLSFRLWCPWGRGSVLHTPVNGVLTNEHTDLQNRSNENTEETHNIALDLKARQVLYNGV